MAGVGSSNISFSSLRTSYNAGGLDDADDDSGLNAGTTNTALSDFRGATFDDDSSIPGGSAAISISSHFRNKTFGSSATTYYLQLNNDDALTNIRYTIDPSTYSSWTSGAGGAPNNTVINAFHNSGELVYTDSNTVISVSIQRQDSEGNWANATSITGFDTSGGSGLTVPSTPTPGHTFTITWSATGSSGSPQVLGLSTD